MLDFTAIDEKLERAEENINSLYFEMMDRFFRKAITPFSLRTTKNRFLRQLSIIRIASSHHDSVC